MNLPATPARRLPAWLWPAIKWGLFALVLWSVSRQAWQMSHSIEDQPTSIRWSWVALSGFLAVAAWIPSLWYWQRLLAAFHCHVPWFPLIHAYYIGHLGKYVPGKAAVIVIRTALLRSFGLGPAVGAYTVTTEALTYMAAGLTNAAALLPFAAAQLPQLPWLQTIASRPLLRGLLPVAVGVTGVLLLIAGSGQFVRLAQRAAIQRGGDPQAFPPLPRGLLVQGFLVFVAGWWLQGASLGAAVAAASPTLPSGSDWPRWTGAAALALVGGFLALFAPGGLGVREAVLLSLLSHLEPRAALLATVLWRAASLLGELTICALLELARWGLRSSPRLPPQPLAPSVALPLGWGLATCLAGLP
ncbi:MAG: YbhN family protein [Planctomycetaceae bacterium]